MLKVEGQNLKFKIRTQNPNHTLILEILQKESFIPCQGTCIHLSKSTNKEPIKPLFLFSEETNLCGACLPYESCQRDSLIGQYRCMCQECDLQHSKDLVCGKCNLETTRFAKIYFLIIFFISQGTDINLSKWMIF